MEEKNQELIAAAKLLKENCDAHSFYSGDGSCDGCVFRHEYPYCPLCDGGVPADWGI